MVISIVIDGEIVDSMAKCFNTSKVNIKPLDLFDEKYYPPRNDEPEKVAMYLAVLVALDHRLSRPGRPYEACLEDGCYHGADLLYRLGKKIYDYEPDFYTPKKLSRITIDDIRKRFNIDGAEVPDPAVRALLLKDLGIKLLKLYNGSFMELLKISGCRLRGTIDKPGLIDLLKIFRAYEDPVEKKSFLLVKSLIARKLYQVCDAENMEIPVDNHLTRIALRTGLVKVRGRLWNYIKSFQPVSYTDDILIRYVVRIAYKEVSRKSTKPVSYIDDILWKLGRTTCLRDEIPKCNVCLFKDFCIARKDKRYMVKEHNYYNTWYY
ncbi:MAG: iron-sulfur cluster loop [Desulfurococcales archaeon]|nr:iron-sulfur cluster loop [Desulfurococcales archaeon]